MVDMVLNASNPICLVGAGALENGDLALADRLCGGFVAADGGAVPLIESGRCPEAVIGDLDSLPEAVQARLDPVRVYRVGEQDSTDFEKALSRISAPLILALGFTGARMDHQLAVLHGLMRFAHVPCVLLAEREVIFHCPPRFRIDLQSGDTVSLFPLSQVKGRSTGLHWPIDGLALAPGQRIGTSNRALGGPMSVEVDTPGMIVILPRSRLELVMQALQDLPPEHGRWPAP